MKELLATGKFKVTGIKTCFLICMSSFPLSYLFFLFSILLFFFGKYRLQSITGGRVANGRYWQFIACYGFYQRRKVCLVIQDRDRTIEREIFSHLQHGCLCINHGQISFPYLQSCKI